MSATPWQKVKAVALGFLVLEAAMLLWGGLAFAVSFVKVLLKLAEAVLLVLFPLTYLSAGSLIRLLPCQSRGMCCASGALFASYHVVGSLLWKEPGAWTILVFNAASLPFLLLGFELRGLARSIAQHRRRRSDGA